MQKTWRRAALAASLSITGALGGLVAAAPAQAQPVASGSVTFSGDQGDYITGGGSYAYSVADGDQLTTSASTDASHVSVNVNGYGGDWWYLDFDAPGSQPLAPGTYENATRYPFNGAGPGLGLDGNGRGCNELTGTFTVLNAVFGPNGYVQTFDATFEQHCEGGTAAARGEVHIANPPAPAPLDLALAVATQGTASTVSGKAVVHGTVTCNQPTSVALYGTVTEIVKKTIVRGTSPPAWTVPRAARRPGPPPPRRAAPSRSSRVTWRSAPGPRATTASTTSTSRSTTPRSSS